MEASSWPLQISDAEGGQGDEEYGITDGSAAVTAAPWPCKLPRPFSLLPQSLLSVYCNWGACACLVRACSTVADIKPLFSRVNLDFGLTKHVRFYLVNSVQTWIN